MSHHRWQHQACFADLAITVYERPYHPSGTIALAWEGRKKARKPPQCAVLHFILHGTVRESRCSHLEHQKLVQLRMKVDACSSRHRIALSPVLEQASPPRRGSSPNGIPAYPASIIRGIKIQHARHYYDSGNAKIASFHLARNQELDLVSRHLMSLALLNCGVFVRREQRRVRLVQRAEMHPRVTTYHLVTTSARRCR